MPLFSATVYHNQTHQKKVIKKHFESTDVARQQLIQEGYLIQCIENVENTENVGYFKEAKDGKENKQNKNQRYCSKQQKITLLQQWSGLLSAGVSLEQTLILGQKQFKGKTAFLLQQLQKNIQEGNTFNKACENFSKDFDSIDIAIIAAGEQSGQLATMMNRLADYRYQQGQMKQSIGGALVYPLIILVVAVMVMIGMMVFVLPQITEVFQEQHQQLPFLTRVLLWSSRQFIHYGELLGLTLLTGITLFLAWIKSKQGKYIWHRYLMLDSPLASLFKEQASSRFALTLSTLLSTQVPLIMALSQSSSVIGNSFLQQLIMNTIEDVKQGQSLSYSLGKTAVFPPLLLHLIANGEKTATLPQMLEKCALQQEQNARRQLQVLTTFLEPLMVVLFGGGVLILVLAILLPIIQLNNQV